jgi:proline iminopeptidase
VNQQHAKRGTARVEGIALDYVVEGAGPLLLVVGSSIYYPRTFPARLRQSCTIVCADLPHFVLPGPEFDIDALSLELYARCVEAIRSAAGLGKVIITGHSHHGNVALEYAKRHPQHVAGVVLMGTPPADLATTIAASREYWKTRASPARKALLEVRRSGLDESRMASLPAAEAYVARYLADAPLYWHEPDYDAAWLWRGLEFDMAAVAAFREFFRDYDARPQLAALEAPMLVVMGRDDYAVPHTLWREIVPALANVTFEMLEQCGHTPQLEDPEAFDQLLSRWIREALAIRVQSG